MRYLIAILLMLSTLTAPLAQSGQAQGDSQTYRDPVLGYTVNWDSSWTILMNDDTGVGGHVIFLFDGNGGVMVTSMIAAPASAEECIGLFAPSFSSATGFEDVQPIPGTAEGDTYNAAETWTATAVSDSGSYPVTIDFHCHVLQEPVGSVVTIAFAPTELYAEESVRLEEFVAESVQLPLQPGTARRFLADRWLTTVVAAGSAPEFPEAGLDASRDNAWVLAVADVINMGNDEATFKPREFTLDSGKGDPTDLDIDATGAVAEQLGFQPQDPARGVVIAPGTSIRVVMVFPVNDVITKGTLVRKSAQMPLTDLLREDFADLDALPVPAAEPYLEEATVSDVEDGQTLILAFPDGGTRKVLLAGYAAPAGSDCFADDATSRLRKLAGETVLVQAGVDEYWVWRERSNGVKALINQEMVDSGFGTVQVADDHPLVSWLEETERLAEADEVGLWAGCIEEEPTTTTEPDESTPPPADDDQSGASYDGAWGGPTTNNGSFSMAITDNMITEFHFTFTCSEDPNSTTTGTGTGGQTAFPIDGNEFSIVIGDWTVTGSFDSANTMSGTAHFGVTSCPAPVDLEFVGIKLP